MKKQMQRIASSAASILIVAAAAVLSGCSGMKDDIDDLKTKTSGLDERLTTLESTVDGLSKAIKDGKLITNVEDLSGTPGGIKITFSDNSSKTIVNGLKGDKGETGNEGAQGSQGVQGPIGENGSTPLIYVDSEGYWCVAPTGTKNPDNTKDRVEANGKPIKAEGAQGAQGPAGPEGPGGNDGNDGRHGTQVSAAFNADHYLELTFIDPNLKEGDEGYKTVITTNIYENGKVIEAIAEKTYYYEFNISGMVYRIAKVNPAPQSVKVLTPATLALKGTKAYAVISVSPSNATITAENIALNYAGDKIVVSRSVSNTYNAPKFAEITGVMELSAARAANWAVPDNDAIAANGGEYAIELNITGEVPFDNGGGNGLVGMGQTYDVMVEYPAAPASINAIVPAAEVADGDQMQIVYTRSVNSIAFVKKLVEFADNTAIAFAPATLNGYFDQELTGSLAISNFNFDHSYVSQPNLEITAITSSEGQTLTASDYFAVEAGIPAEDAAATVLNSIKVIPTAADNVVWKSIATGEVLTLTIKATVTDMTGTELEADLTVNVTKVISQVVLTDDATLIPIEDKEIKFTWATIANRIKNTAGFSTEDVNAIVWGTTYELLKTEATNGKLADAAAVTSGTDFESVVTTLPVGQSDMKITLKNTINTGRYFVKVPYTIKGHAGHVIFPVKVSAAEYTVKLKTGVTLEELTNTLGAAVKGYKKFTTGTDVVGFKVKLEDVIDVTTVNTSTSGAPGYNFVDPSVTLAGNKKGLVASSVAIGYDKDTDGKAQKVALSIKYATGQEIPVKVIDAGSAQAGNIGEIYIAIFSDKAASIVTDPVSGGFIATAVDFITAQTAQDITALLTSATFTDVAGTAYTVSGYEALTKDNRIKSVKFEAVGLDPSGTTGIQFPTGQTNLIVIDQTTDKTKVTYKTAGNITSWTGEAYQKIKITVTDKWDTSFSGTVILKVTNAIIP